MSNSGLLPVLEYKARLELKEKYSSKGNLIHFLPTQNLQRLSTGDFMGVFMVGSICLSLTIILFSFEKVSKAEKKIKKKKTRTKKHVFKF